MYGLLKLKGRYIDYVVKMKVLYISFILMFYLEVFSNYRLKLYFYIYII